jgi:hypothetical protein
MDAKITITTWELLSVSLDIRRQIKDSVVSKKVFTNIFNNNNTNSYLMSYFHDEVSSSPFNMERYHFTPTSSSAAATLPLYVISLLFSSRVKVNCILNGRASYETNQIDQQSQYGARTSAQECQ